MQTTPRLLSCVGLLFAAFGFDPEAAAQTNTFSLQADPTSIEVAPAHSNTVTISSAVVSGSAETISFSGSGAPANVTLSFNPTSVEAGSSTTLTITANSSATLGATATITVQGTAPSDSESTTVSLRIASYLPLEEWTTLEALYDATGGSEWTKNTGWDFSSGAPNGTECAWYGIECDTTPHVIAIDLQTNNLVGQLPELGAFIHLSTIDFVGNSLTGPLPASIQNLSALTQLAVSSNQLSGGLDELDGLSNLQYFGGDDNAFTGTLPRFDSLPSLMGFSADTNQLTGPMPSLGLSSKLVYLDISENYLSGTVPSLSALTNLRYLYISGNRFTGAMPNPPSPTQLGRGAVFLCANFFAPVANSQWDLLSRTTPWYSNCDTDTIFAFGFGSPPTLQ